MFFFNRKNNVHKQEETKNKYVENNINEIEIDPLAEADVYLAYGRHQQAFTILQEALNNKKITEQHYLDFLNAHNLKDLNSLEVFNNLNNANNLKQTHNKDKENSSNYVVFYKYYISFTVVNNNSTIKQRVFIETKNSIHTENGIKEVEKSIDNIIKGLFIDDLLKITWNLDSYIDINIE